MRSAAAAIRDRIERIGLIIGVLVCADCPWHERWRWATMN